MSTRRLRSWWRKRKDADFQAEVRAHLELEADRLTAGGLEPLEAQYTARRAFGNLLAAEERFYEASRWMWLDQLRQDVRYAARTLWRSRTFAVTTVLTLAVALGLVTVLFAVFNAYVLRPFAIHDPYRIYQLAWQSPDGGDSRFTWREYEEIAQRGDLFNGAVAHRWQMVSSDDRQVHAAFVSGNYFDTLRPRLRFGRTLAAFDANVPGAAPVAVLSDQGWALLFDRDPDVLGRRLHLNGHTFEIVGVMRPEFSGMDDSPLDLWAPLTMLPTVSGTDVYGPAQPRELTIFARLDASVTPAQAGHALASFMLRAAQTRDAGGGAVKPEEVRPDLRQRATPNPLTLELIAVLSPVFTAFGLVLVAACANVSSVMLARALGRQREIGIRLSVGASRGRIVRQLLTEALIISTLAGVAGLVLADSVLQMGRRLFFASLPASLADLARVVPLEVDIRVFAFALSLATIATLLCALAPALQATRLRLTDALRGQVGLGFRSGTLRNLLVIGQVTVSLVLLIAAATLTRNGLAVGATDLGFDTHDVFSVNQRGPSSALIPAAARALALDPRVAQIAITNRNPLFGVLDSIGVKRAGVGQTGGNSGTAKPDETVITSFMFVSPEYFPLLRIPIVRGRGFSAAESQAETHVAIVSEATASRLWPGVDPIGRVVRIVPGADQNVDALAGFSDILVVGVAKDVVSGLIYDGQDASLIYLPTSPTGKHAGALLARGGDTGLVQREALERVLERVDVNRAAFEVLPLGELTEIMLYPLRMASWIGSLLGCIALALSVSGLYGLLMYVLGQRTREIGIRMALGATAAGVVRLVVRQSARVVGVGAAIGVIFAFIVLKLLGSVISLRNVSVLDAWAFAAGIALIAVAAAVATYFPARRATNVDPCRTLRADG